MTILEYIGSDCPEHWREAIGQSDWKAGKMLWRLLTEGTLEALCGAGARVLLLTEGGALLSFCTYAPQDDVPDKSLTPWTGFVYTFPRYRGHRYVGLLLDRAAALAAADGHEYLHISTNEVGLYEKYGFTYWKDMTDYRGNPSRVYRRRSHD